MKSAPSLALLAFALIGLSACTSQQWYAASRPALQEQCLRLTVEVQYRDCIASASLDHESYQRRRAQIDTPQNLRD